MKRLLLVVTTSGLLFGCAHSLKHGTVAMKESDQLAHVSIHDVKQGEKLILFRNNCTKSGGDKGGGGGRDCKREQLGEGTVLRVLNEHYSVVEFPTGTTFKEGDFVATR